MKKLTTIFGSVFFASIVLTSCGGGMEAELEEVCNNVCESRSIMDKANEDPTNYDKLEKEAREIGEKNATRLKQLREKYKDNAEDLKELERLYRECKCD